MQTQLAPAQLALCCDPAVKSVTLLLGGWLEAILNCVKHLKFDKVVAEKTVHVEAKGGYGVRSCLSPAFQKQC